MWRALRSARCAVGPTATAQRRSVLRYSDDLNKMVRAMLTVDVTKRQTVDDLLQA